MHAMIAKDTALRSICNEHKAEQTKTGNTEPIQTVPAMTRAGNQGPEIHNFNIISVRKQKKCEYSNRIVI